MATCLTTSGAQWIRDNLSGTTTSVTADYIGWGTGAGTAAKPDTTLFTEASEARTLAQRTLSGVDTIQWIGTITANGTKTITNAGNFTNVAAGSLVVHGDFTGIALNANDWIQFTINLQIT